MITSTIPAALDGLVSLLRASADLRGVQVFDGQPTIDSPNEYVLVGYAEDGGAAVTGQQEPAALGNLRRSETYAIECQVSAWTGATDMKVVRNRAFALLDAVAKVVRNNGTLGGAVTFADYGNRFEVAQIQTQQGAVVTVNFTVDVKVTRI